MKNSQDMKDPDVVVTFKMKEIGEGIATAVEVKPSENTNLDPQDVFMNLLTTLSDMSEQFGVTSNTFGSGVFTSEDHETVQ